MSPADPDGDSNMRSSSSSDAESEAMFPDEAHEAHQTPSGPSSQTLAHLRQTELSPPSSQDHIGNTSAGMDDLMDISGPARDALQQGGEAGHWRNGGRGRADGAGKGAVDEQEPGWSWKNAKAREEMLRAMDTVEDKNFNLREFGDLIEHGQGQNGGGVNQ